MQILDQEAEPAAIGNVLEPMATFVLDDIALIIELRLVHSVKESRKAVRFEPEQVLQIARRGGYEVVGAVIIRCAVYPALAQVRSGLLGIGEVLPGGIL